MRLAWAAALFSRSRSAANLTSLGTFGDSRRQLPATATAVSVYFVLTQLNAPVSVTV